MQAKITTTLVWLKFNGPSLKFTMGSNFVSLVSLPVEIVTEVFHIQGAGINESLPVAIVI